MDGYERDFDDRTPGVEDYEPTASYFSYSVGLGLMIHATIASFVVSQTNLLWFRASRSVWSCSPSPRSAFSSSFLCI